MPGSARRSSQYALHAHLVSAAILALSLLLVSTLPCTSVSAGLPDGWVSFDGTTAEPESPRVELVSQSSSEIVLRVTTPGVLSESVSAEGSDYVRLTCPDYFRTITEKSPELPAIRQFLA